MHCGCLCATDMNAVGGGWGGGAEYPADRGPVDLKSGGLSIKKADFTVRRHLHRLAAQMCDKLNFQPQGSSSALLYEPLGGSI